MNRITKGNIYRAAFVLQGNSQKGPYECIKVRSDDAGKKTADELAIFVSEDCLPTGITVGDKFKVNELLEITRGWKPNPKANEQGQPKWLENISVNAKVKRIESDLDGINTDVLGDEFADINNMKAPWEDDDELPY